jgi:predicted DNA-binding transcriptional regulator AlpA
MPIMLSTTQVAKQFGMAPKTLSRYIAAGKVPAPTLVQVGGLKAHAWSESDIERLRKLLPKIANGRKTRYQKLKEKKGAQPGAAVPHKSRKTKKKK